MTFESYEIEKTVLNIGKIDFHVAHKNPGQKRFLLKTIPKEGASSRTLEQFKHEFDTTRTACVDGILSPLEYIDTKEMVALVYKDAHLVPLSLLLEKGKIDISFTLETGFKLTSTLFKLHQNGYIHHEITPNTIWLDPNGETVNLMGMGSSRTPMGFSNQDEANTKTHWMYRSPEQAGRQNNRIDHRTDFYSLGAVLFTMITGYPPFDGVDFLELIHNHIAKSIPDLKEIVPNIPPVLSEIVQKLMSKSADDRYLNAASIMVDLRRCCATLEKGGKEDSFRLDVLNDSNQFEYPTMLYGRDKELNQLRSSLELVLDGACVLTMITGYSGVGKTSLISEFEKNIPQDRGYFASGKYETINSSTPYSGILKALVHIAKLILMESDEEFQKIKSLLIETLGNNIGVITNLIPEFESILEEAPSLSYVKILESRNRLHRCIQKIIKALCDHKGFLIVFLDDLQWIDQASLELIKSIMESNIKGLFFIGVYRDNEVFPSHMLRTAFAEPHTHGASIETLYLQGLKQEDIEKILKDALQMPEQDIVSLARIIHRKTGGNPIIIKEFVEVLVRKKFIHVNNRMEWEWDPDTIELLEIDQDIDLLARQKLSRLTQEVRHTISMAAVLGNSFQEHELAPHVNTSPEELEKHLRTACGKRVLISLGKGRYQFEHDRLQENAYQMIPDDDKTKIHLRLGRAMTKNDTRNKNRFFEHITHMNVAHHLLKDDVEKVQLARLNLTAGKQAKDVAAFTESYKYLTTGIEILGDDPWDRHYALALALFSQAATLAYLSCFFDESEKLSQEIIRFGKTDSDRTLGYEARVESAMFLNKTDEAITITLKALSHLGIPLSFSTTRQEAIGEALKSREIARRLLKVPCSQVPPMADSKFHIVMRLLMHGVKATGWNDYPLYWVLVGKMLEITKAHGFIEESAFGLVAAGGMFCHLLGEYDLGCRVAEYGLAYMEKNNITKWKLDTQVYFNEEITCLREHPDVAVKALTALYYQSVENGSILTAMESAHAACIIGFFGSMRLVELEHLCNKFDAMLSLSFPGIKPLQSNLKMINEIVLQLSSIPDQSEVTRLSCFDTGSTDKEITINMKLFSYSLFRRKEAAEQEAIKVLSYGSSFIMIPTRFYALLSLPNRHGDKGYCDVVNGLSCQFKQRAKFSHINYDHRYHLIKAEELKREGKFDTALVHYEKAIFIARERRFIMDEAMAWELTAEFFMELGATRLSEFYLKEAFNAYAQWGSNAKLNQLRDSHPFLLHHQPPRIFSMGDSQKPSNAGINQTSVMDMDSIDRAVVTLISAMDGTTLLQKLMLILLQNSGAERGYLLSHQKEDILVECHVAVDEEMASLPPRTAVENFQLISHSIVRYVCRTNKQIISPNLTEDIQFGHTGYVKETGLKSVLCMPITYQNKTAAFLYLESQQVKNAFTQERFPTIQLLSNQIAAAIERIRLHRELVQEIENRKAKEQELRVTLKKLNQLKDSLNEENHYLKEEIRNNHGFKDIIGKSPALKKALYLVEQVVSFDTTTLILGESGTGKELIARSIHELSPRRDHPMIKVNCAALPTTLIESELFGYEKGAFTGAVKTKKGRFEMADRGTLFLDEIGDMPMEVQVKLLRVLQDGKFEPLGSDKTLTVNVRVVAATNRDLEESILKGEFREDLYYRLSIFPIKVPALRDRKEDIPLLVNYFIDKKNHLLKKNIEKIPSPIMNALIAYDWPGNIRELENVIERAVILSHATTLALDDSFKGMPKKPAALISTNLEEAMKRHIIQVLDMCDWKIKGPGNAAERLDLNPSTLRSKIKKLGIVRQGGGHTTQEGSGL